MLQGGRFVLKMEMIFLPNIIALPGESFLLSRENTITGSIKAKLNVREDGDRILAMGRRLNQRSISQVQESYIKYNQNQIHVD